jgi:hypothetical protein
MEELQPLPLPEATEVFYPEPDWHKRYYNIFDWFRAQTTEIRYAALMQWHAEGKAHQLTGEGQDPYNRCELWYCEPGRFFVEIGLQNGKVNNNMAWFQSASCLNRYGVAVLRQCKQMGFLPPKT